MNKLIRTIAAVAAVSFTVLANISGQAFAIYTVDKLRQDYPELPTGFTDQTLSKVVRLHIACRLERELHLQAGWTGDDYAHAKAAELLRQIGQDFGVSAGFTRDQLVDSEAAKRLERFASNHGLPTHFSQSDLIQAEGRRGAVGFGYRGQSEPLAEKEFAALAGKAVDEEYIKEWHLSEHWTFEDLRAFVGPERAARLASERGIKPGMTHAEIVEQLGKSETARYVKQLKLSTPFTADEAVQAAGLYELDFLRRSFEVQGAEELNEGSVLKQLRVEVLADLEQRYTGLTGNFNEQQLRDFLVKQADAEMRATYGFNGPYDEYDATGAMAESVVAELRLSYNLPLHFTEEEVNRAMAASQRPDL